MNRPLARNPQVELQLPVNAPVHDRVRGYQPPPSELRGRMIPLPTPLSSECEELLNALLLERGHPGNTVYRGSREGGNNSLVLFDCKETPSYQYPKFCIRTPRYIYFSRERHYPIYQQVKTLVALTYQFGVHGVGLPIPYIFLYDSGFRNAISCPYVIMQLISGITLEKLYRTMRRSANILPVPLQYCELARQMAHFIARKESVKFPGYGALRNETDTETWNREDSNACYNLAVEQLNVAGKMIPKFGFSKFVAHLTRKEFDKYFDLQAVGQRYQGIKLGYVWQAMTERDLFSDQDSTLWHPDFHPRNILVVRHGNDVRLSGVVDWDNALALPRIMTREPPSFLWNQPGVLTQPEADTVKRAFDETIEQLVPGYIEDAYSRIRVLIRALGMYVLYGPQWKHYGEISFEEFLLESERLFSPHLRFPNK